MLMSFLMGMLGGMFGAVCMTLFLFHLRDKNEMCDMWD